MQAWTNVARMRAIRGSLSRIKERRPCLPIGNPGHLIWHWADVTREKARAMLEQWRGHKTATLTVIQTYRQATCNLLADTLSGKFTNWQGWTGDHTSRSDLTRQSEETLNDGMLLWLPGMVYHYYGNTIKTCQMSQFWVIQLGSGGAGPWLQQPGSSILGYVMYPHPLLHAWNRFR